MAQVYVEVPMYQGQFCLVANCRFVLLCDSLRLDVSVHYLTVVKGSDFLLWSLEIILGNVISSENVPPGWHFTVVSS